MGFDQPMHWLVIIAVGLVLFFGYKKLPEMARSAGRSMRIFKTELKGMADDDDARQAAKQEAVPPAPPAPPSVVAPPNATPNGLTSSDSAPVEPPPTRAD
jgi:sec-independent protein translocase protein TatA